MGFVLRVLANAGALALADYLLPGIVLSGLGATLVAGLVLGLVNAVVRPVLVVLTFPLTLVTLGLFLFVLNALCLWLTAALVPGFDVLGFWSALLASLIVSAVSWLLTAFISDTGRVARLC